MLGYFEDTPLARDTGPRWSCRTYAPGPELELSYARATVPRWSSPTCATGPSGRCPARAPRAEVEQSDAHQRPSLECSQVPPEGGAARRLPGSRAGRLDAVAGRLLARVGNAPKKFVAPFAVLP